MHQTRIWTKLGETPRSERSLATDQLNEAKRLVEAWRPRKAEELKTLEIALPAAPGAPARPCPAMP
jgi:hypothetical protein